MTKEEIYKRADIYVQNCPLVNADRAEMKRGYYDGAVWMQKQLIDKACDFLITALNEGLMQTSDIGKLNMMLRKAMEG